MRRSTQPSALSTQPRDILLRAFLHLALRSDEVERIEDYQVFFCENDNGPDREALGLLKKHAEASLVCDEIKIFAMNDCDWVAARSVGEAKQFYLSFVTHWDDDECEPEEELGLDTLTYGEDDLPERITFRQQLERLKAEGASFPAFFASTEY